MKRSGNPPYGIDQPALRDRIETDLPAAPPAARWTMNFCLAAIGIRTPALRGRAMARREKLGVDRTFPVSRGCTSPFAPLWIAEMVRRTG